MSKKSKKPRKGRKEAKQEAKEITASLLAQLMAPIKPEEAIQQPRKVAKASKNKRYRDLLVAPGTELWQALEDNDQEQVSKLYKASQKEWKDTYGDFNPAAINDRIQKRFRPWDGTYDKEFYDVKLKTGEIVDNCWPNAGFMMTIDGSGGQYSVDDVEGIRFAVSPPR